MCHHVFIYDERDKNTNLQTNGLVKYISNTLEAWHKIKPIATR